MDTIKKLLEKIKNNLNIIITKLKNIRKNKKQKTVENIENKDELRENINKLANKNLLSIDVSKSLKKIRSYEINDIIKVIEDIDDRNKLLLIKLVIKAKEYKDKLTNDSIKGFFLVLLQLYFQLVLVRVTLI